MKNRIKVETEDKTVYVKRPNRLDYQKAQAISSGSFRAALDSGAILRSELDKYAEERGLWDDEKQKRLEELNNSIEEKVLKLKKGGISLSEGKEIAIDISALRLKRTLLMSERNQLDAYTAETIAENDRFDCLVSQCVVDEENNKVFDSLDDYKEKSHEDYASKAAASLSILLYNLDEDWEKELPENQFLLRYGFVNDELQLIDKDGNLVDVNGKRINKNFQYVNDEGKVIDEDGNLVDEDGTLIVESQPFLDDDGNPIE